jgi:hypothetical protein
MRLRVLFILALLAVMLVTATAAAHGRVFGSAGHRARAHRITVAPSAIVVAPGLVAVSGVHVVPQVILVITPPHAIRPSVPVIVRHPSATFFPPPVTASPPVPDAGPTRVTVPARRLGPQIIMVGPAGATHQR